MVVKVSLRDAHKTIKEYENLGYLYVGIVRTIDGVTLSFRDPIVPEENKLTITVSYDEKPGIQAISNTAPDLRPIAENGEVL